MKIVLLLQMRIQILILGFKGLKLTIVNLLDVIHSRVKNAFHTNHLQFCQKHVKINNL